MGGELAKVGDIVCAIGNVKGLSPDQDFYEAGVSSVSALNLLMELESAYGVNIPDERFVTARSVRQLSAIIEDLKARSESGDSGGVPKE